MRAIKGQRGSPQTTPQVGQVPNTGRKPQFEERWPMSSGGMVEMIASILVGISLVIMVITWLRNRF